MNRARLNSIPALCITLLLASLSLSAVTRAAGAPTLALAQGPATAPAKTNPFGAALYGTDRIDDAPMPRTKITLIGYRHFALRYAVAGYLRSHVPLVAFDGVMYLKAGFGDDPGIYWFIPKLAAATDLSLEESIDLFFGTILIVAFVSGILGLLLTLDNWPLKLWAVFGLCMLLWFSYRKGDVYLTLSATAVGIIPWCFYLLKKNSSAAYLAAFLFVSGVAVGFANEIRGYAGTAVLIFLAMVTAFALKRSPAARLALLACLALGVLVPTDYFHTLLSRRDAFLAAAEPGYTNTVDHHSIWHSLYIGLGYLPNNPYVAGYRDEVAAEAVYRISPTTQALSPEYERILRSETLRIAREHPKFIAATLFAKLRILIFLLVCWANVGLLAAAFYPKGWAIESAFWAALAFTALFGIIAIPQIQYLLGFLAFATLYGIFSIDWALKERYALAKQHSTAEA